MGHKFGMLSHAEQQLPDRFWFRQGSFATIILVTEYAVYYSSESLCAQKMPSSETNLQYRIKLSICLTLCQMQVSAVAQKADLKQAF